MTGMRSIFPSRVTSSIATAAIVCALCVPTRTAGAQAANEDEQREQSRALWKRGAQKYELAKWEEAITLFEEAYDVWPFPEILFNLCQAHRQNKNYERAIFFCRAYLRHKPDAEDRDLVVELVDEMMGLMAQDKEVRDRPPEGVAPPPEPEPMLDSRADDTADEEPLAGAELVLHDEPRAIARESWHQDWWAWALSAGGGLGVAIGIGLLVDADGIDAAAERESDQIERVRLRERADDRRGAGYAVTSVGVGVLAAGVIKLILHDNSSDDAALGGVALGPGWIGIRGRF